jgi:hypothetical protein
MKSKADDLGMIDVSRLYTSCGETGFNVCRVGPEWVGSAGRLRAVADDKREDILRRRLAILERKKLANLSHKSLSTESNSLLGEDEWSSLLTVVQR